VTPTPGESGLRRLKRPVLEAQEYVRLVAATCRGFFVRPVYARDIVAQFDFIGVGSATVVLLTAFFTGAAVASQTAITLDRFGARPVVGKVVSASMVRDLGPVLTALMLAGRIGSGIAAELGSMVVTDQVNALRALGTDPIRKLVVPRVLAGFCMAPALTVIADLVGIFSGWIVARFQFQVTTGLYWSSVTDVLYIQDVWMGVIKPFILGFVVVTIACHIGLRTTGGTQGVGRSTTSAVVAGSIGVIAVDFFVTQLFLNLIY
jgi:phospholipid/cholesterol/gamma-HCH transport system permease protein